MRQRIGRRTLLGGVGALAAGGVLAACSAQNDSAGESSSSQNNSGGTDVATHVDNVQGSGSRVLVAYFSRPGENYWEGGRRNLAVGNTELLAGMIAQRIATDVFCIDPATPYPYSYDDTVELNVREEQDNARPEIVGQLPDLSAYDTVLLGCPVWNSRAPMIMSTFIEGADFTGTTLLPFVTHAMSGISGVQSGYRRALPGINVPDGFAVLGSEVSEAGESLDQWLRTNSLMA